MTASSPALESGGTARADAAITAEREETKYLLDKRELPSVLSEIATHLDAHRYSGEAANRLPGAEHFVTTIYFDTQARAYFKAARLNQRSNIKIRAKEYYDVHPSLAELATDPAQILRYQPWLWFELKRREGLVTSKRRFRFPKTAAATLFEQQHAPELLQQDATERADAEALIAHVRSQAEPIEPSTIVNYRRLSFQNPDSTLRVTLDLGLAFFAVPSDLFRRTRPLSRAELGKPAGVEPRVVVEIKRLCPLPSWLTEALARSGASPVSFSKFVAASGAVYGA